MPPEELSSAKHGGMPAIADKAPAIMCRRVMHRSEGYCSKKFEEANAVIASIADMREHDPASERVSFAQFGK